MDHKKLATEILNDVGGENNVVAFSHCATRLRFKLKDDQKADPEAIEKLTGVFSVVNRNGQLQVVIGNEVSFVYNELEKKISAKNTDPDDNKKKKYKFSDTFDAIFNIFIPCVPVLTACGILKGLLSLSLAYGWLDIASQTYIIINTIAEAGFYFLPILLAYTTAQRFKVNPFFAVVLAGALLYPGLTTLFNSGETVKFLGLNIMTIDYSSSVMPIIIAVIAMHYIQQFFERYTPKELQTIIVPLGTLLIMVPITLWFIGPLGNLIDDLVAYVLMFIEINISWLIPTIIGAFTPLLVMTGMHYSLFPFGFQQLARYGYQTIFIGMLPSNTAQSAAALAVGLKSKNKELKKLGFSSSASALLGITEPSLYGITTKLKKPLYAVMIGGALGGFFMGINNVHAFTPNGISLQQIIVYCGGNSFNNVINVLISAIIAFVSTFILTYVFGFEDPANEKNPPRTLPKEEHIKSIVYAPISGKTRELKTVNDPTFASEVMGKGIAIVPENGQLVSPVSGTVTALFYTNHSIGITSDDGLKILIHIGIDTVELDGKGFVARIKKGDKVSIGQPLIDFNLPYINEQNYDPTIMLIITNSSDYLEIVPTSAIEVRNGDKLLTAL